MLEIDRHFLAFKRKDIWFSDSPFDVDHCQGVMFYSCPNKVNARGFYRRATPTMTLDLTQDADSLWNNFHSHRKKSIKKAEKLGVTIKRNQDYERFYEMDQAFRKKKKGMPKSFVNVDYMRRYGTLFVAELEGELLSGTFYLEDQDNIRALIGASGRLDADKSKARLMGDADKLIDWAAINYAREKGIKVFDLGGYYTGAGKNEDFEKINSVKASYGGELALRFSYEKSYSKVYHLARMLYSLRSMPWSRLLPRDALRNQERAS
ncbi:MAG: hypothetical protein WBZ29_12870 [Methanocella sp.]